MVQPRQPRYVEHGEWIVPDICEVVLARAWTEQANCIGEDKLFGAEGVGPTINAELAAPTELLEELICAGCSVRVQCLHSSLEPPALSPVTPGREWGSGRDRPLGPSADPWSPTRGVCCAARVDVPRTAPYPDRGMACRLWHRVESGGAISKRDRRVGAILAEDMPERKHKLRKRKVGRFTLGGQPGPGRGHKGPIAAYVAEHGCSRDTASRRLRAS